MNLVITGGTKGIGRAIIEKFASEGHTIITCSRSSADLDDLTKSLKASHSNITIYTKVIDLEVKDQVAAFAKFIIELKVGIDVLVNNAGLFFPGTITNEADEVYEQMMQVNVGSAYQLTRKLLPAMIERKAGHIFSICSVASTRGMPEVGSYGISKYALLGFSRHLREELKPMNIKVTAVIPASTYTASWEGSGVDKARLIDAADIAEMVYAASILSANTVIDDIVITPQAGGL